jgi:hypothetical protein
MLSVTTQGVAGKSNTMTRRCFSNWPIGPDGREQEINGCAKAVRKNGEHRKHESLLQEICDAERQRRTL